MDIQDQYDHMGANRKKEAFDVQLREGLLI